MLNTIFKQDEITRITVSMTVLLHQTITQGHLEVEVVHRVVKGQDIHKKAQQILTLLQPLVQFIILRMDIRHINHLLPQQEVINVSILQYSSLWEGKVVIPKHSKLFKLSETIK